MSRFDLYKLPTDKQKELLDRFFLAVASLSSYKEVKDFFKDLLTPQETTMFARRIKVAEMLLADKCYDEISKQLKIGLGTIARVHRWVNSERGGYKVAIEQLKKLDARAQRHHERKMWKYSNGWKKIKSIYPTLDADMIQDIVDLIGDSLKKQKRKKSVKKMAERTKKTVERAKAV